MKTSTNNAFRGKNLFLRSDKMDEMSIFDLFFFWEEVLSLLFVLEFAYLYYRGLHKARVTLVEVQQLDFSSM